MTEFQRGYDQGRAAAVEDFNKGRGFEGFGAIHFHDTFLQGLAEGYEDGYQGEEQKLVPETGIYYREKECD